MGKIDVLKVTWILDLLVNSDVSTDEELSYWFVKEGQIDKVFADELVKYRTFGDVRKSQSLEDFVYDNIDKLTEED